MDVISLPTIYKTEKHDRTRWPLAVNGFTDKHIKIYIYYNGYQCIDQELTQNMTVATLKL